MADNYLENRMEEYRSGRLAARSRTTPSMRSPRKNNGLVLSYGPMVTVMVADEVTPLLDAAVATFTAVGCRVAFTAGDAKRGTELAQRTGARYYPSSVAPSSMTADVAARWGEVEVAVTFGASSTLLPAGARVIDAAKLESSLTNDSETAPPAARIARHILYLAHPDNTFLLG